MIIDFIGISGAGMARYIQTKMMLARCIVRYLNKQTQNPIKSDF